MKNLEEIRTQIDAIDDELKALYLKRMALSKEVALSKKESGKKVTDNTRESKIVYRLTDGVDDEMKTYIKEIYSSIFATSKAYQANIIGGTSKSVLELERILEGEFKDMPIRSAVACQGVSGANSEKATNKLFQISDITFFKTFEGVFSAVQSGLCEYGILPIENSTAGSVSEVYDLMVKYNFRIVRSVRVKIEHCLAVVKGATLKDIKKVVSHPQALMQCKGFLAQNKLASEEVLNTAVGAKMVAENGDKSVAVLCSLECANMYGLEVLMRSVQDNKDNFTRFICIAKNLEIYNGSDRISVMTTLPHKSGSLSNLLSRFSSVGINLTKIESRPIVGTDFEFMFYFDFEGDIRNKEILNILAELENNSDKFVFLGAYKEIL